MVHLHIVCYNSGNWVHKVITEYEGWNLNLNVSIKTTVLTLFGMGEGEEDFSPELLLWLFFRGAHNIIPFGQKWRAWFKKISPLDSKLLFLEPTQILVPEIKSLLDALAIIFLVLLHHLMVDLMIGQAIGFHPQNQYYGHLDWLFNIQEAQLYLTFIKIWNSTCCDPLIVIPWK